MSTTSQIRLATPGSGLPHRLAAHLAAAAARILESVRRRRALRRQIRALEQLDHRTLRDIGLQRQEITSVAAELNGIAPPSRRQVRGGRCA